MKIQDILKMKKGKTFFYKNLPAKVLWDDQTKFSIGKFKNKETGQEREIFWQSASICFEFSLENELKTITITSHYPDSEDEFSEFKN